MADDKDTMDEWAAAMAEAEGEDGAKAVDLEELKDEKSNITFIAIFFQGLCTFYLSQSLLKVKHCSVP